MPFRDTKGKWVNGHYHVGFLCSKKTIKLHLSWSHATFSFDFPKRKKGQIGLLQKTNIKGFFQEKHNKKRQRYFNEIIALHPKKYQAINKSPLSSRDVTVCFEMESLYQRQEIRECE